MILPARWVRIDDQKRNMIAAILAMRPFSKSGMRLRAGIKKENTAMVMFRRCAVALTTLGVSVGIWGAVAIADLTPSLRVGQTPDDGVIRVSAPEGYCAFNPDDPKVSGVKTGFQPGVEHATNLLAMYVPCPALQQVAVTQQGWLPEWFAYETNYIVFPETDDLADPVTRQSRPRAHGAVAQLCIDAQTGHPRVAGETFAAQVAAAHQLLSAAKPVIYLGVVDEDPGACYLSQLRLESGSPGDYKRLLTVTAFMQAGGKWVYQSVRVHMPSALPADAVLARSKDVARQFIDANR